MSNYPPIQTSTPADSSDVTISSNSVFPTSTPAMIEELQAQNERLQGERSGFEKTIESLRNALNGLEYNVDKLIERIMELVESGDLEEYVAEELGSIVGRDLIRTVTVSVTAEIDIEVNVPVGYDLENLEGDLDVEITSIYLSDVDIVNSETSSLSVEV